MFLVTGFAKMTEPSFKKEFFKKSFRTTSSVVGFNWSSVVLCKSL